MPAHTGSDFYDDDAVFAQYAQHRALPLNANDLLELPIVLELLPDVQKKSVLDVGCGDGRFAQMLVARGAAQVTGIDGSENMIAQARTLPADPRLQFHRARLEAFAPAPQTFHLVTARLVLHYIENIAAIFSAIATALTPSGHFIFSVEHPCLTAGPTDWNTFQRRDSAGVWPIDDYFLEGPRDIRWMGTIVRKYHRTVETYATQLLATGFVIEAIRESRPQPARIPDPPRLASLQRLPLFLFFRARLGKA